VTFRRFFSASREAGRDQTRLTKSLSSQLVDILQGIKALKAMSREDLVWPLLEADTEGLNLAERRQVSAAEALKAFQEPILTLLLATGLYVLLVIMNQRLVSVLVLAFVFYRLMQHINTLQIRYQVMAVGESAFFSIREQIDQAHAQREVYSGTRDPGRIQDSIRIENVHFSYGAEPVLRGVDLEIPAGTFVSVSGESGSGKTTLADLLVGLHEPSSGRIVVDGVPLDEIDMSQWRSRIGYVPQEMLLFHGTVLQNVTLGDESLTEEDARRALEMAGAWGFVQAKAGGLHRQLGEKGGLLSGGQRQRIAIARGLVTDPTLLILDEVTTALDPETEQEIATTLRELAGSVTIFSISHQPALREVSDVAYLMQKGRLVRIGRTPAFEGEASRA